MAWFYRRTGFPVPKDVQIVIESLQGTMIQLAVFVKMDGNGTVFSGITNG